jgi:hypothetical protein
MCVLIFSTIFDGNTFHYKKNWGRYYHKCIYTFMQSASYSCQILIRLAFSRQSFEKSSHIKFHRNPSSRSRVVSRWETDRQTDMLKLTVATRNTAKATILGYNNAIQFHHTYVCTSSIQMYVLFPPVSYGGPHREREKDLGTFIPHSGSHGC